MGKFLRVYRDDINEFFQIFEGLDQGAEVKKNNLDRN